MISEAENRSKVGRLPGQPADVKRGLGELLLLRDLRKDGLLARGRLLGAVVEPALQRGCGGMGSRCSSAPGWEIEFHVRERV